MKEIKQTEVEREPTTLTKYKAKLARDKKQRAYSSKHHRAVSSSAFQRLYDEGSLNYSH
jgi:hypothetical protein